MKQIIAASSLIVLLAGCNRSEPSTYEIPKQPAPASTQQSPQTAMGSMGSAADMEAVKAAHAEMMGHTQQTSFTVELPEGWSEKGASGMRMANYAIEGTSIDFYLISLSIGDVPSNVNRWRGQVGLPPATPEDIAGDVQQFEVDGHNVNYIEIYNEESGKGIIAAIVDLSPSYWYFTAKGSVDELKANTADIRKFIEGIKFQ